MTTSYNVKLFKLMYTVTCHLRVSSKTGMRWTFQNSIMNTLLCMNNLVYP